MVLDSQRPVLVGSELVFTERRDNSGVRHFFFGVNHIGFTLYQLLFNVQVSLSFEMILLAFVNVRILNCKVNCNFNNSFFLSKTKN